MRQERADFYAESVEPIRLEGLLDLPEGDGPYPAGILCAINVPNGAISICAERFNTLLPPAEGSP